MAAIITDQIRILNAKNFVDDVQNSSNSYYAWIGLPNAPSFQSDWDSNPQAPKDSLGNLMVIGTPCWHSNELIRLM